MIVDLSGSGTTAQWMTVIVSFFALVIASIFAYRQIAITNEQKDIIKRQLDIAEYRNRKAFLVARAKKLQQSYPAGGYVVDILNLGDGIAANVMTSINGKTISESPDIMPVQHNISTIAPKDSITYRLKDLPPVGIDISISWADATGELGKYENKLIMY